MIDLHIHVLPGVDDGPSESDQAVEMCRIAAAAGCEVLVATPHQRHPSWWNTDVDRLALLLADLQAAIGDGPRLLLGAEIRIDSHLLSALEGLPDSGILTLAGSRYLLLEADRYGIGPDPLELVYELTLKDWRPILAHPEFVPGLGDDVDRARQLVEAGAMLQVTASSVTGRFGRGPRRTAFRLLDAGLVHFIASDAHGTRFRPPDLGEARALIASRWGDETARRLSSDNPLAVVEDRPLSAGPA